MLREHGPWQGGGGTVRIVLLAAAFLVTLAVGFVVGVAAERAGEETASAPPPHTVTVEKTVERTLTVQEETTATATTTATAAAAREQAEMECQIRQECDLGVSSITITSAKQAQTINTSPGDTFEGNFVIVEFDYTYGGSAPADTGEPPFQVYDGDNNAYSLHFEATSAYGIDHDRTLIFTTVQPGVPTQGTAIFEVSPNAEDFTLLVADLISPQTNKAAEIPLPF
jgi:Domain of unknown function (DUF4352)